MFVHVKDEEGNETRYIVIEDIEITDKSRCNIAITINDNKRYLDAGVVEDVIAINCNKNLKTVLSCSGHGKYHKTIFVNKIGGF